jgi:tetratricopeptide (TPR) repeat protein
MRRIPAIAILLLSAIYLPAPPAHAQPQPPVEDTRARELFLEGEAHYAAGRYEQAAERYLEAYQLSQRPELLFNVGNAYERLGDYEKAAEYLRQYADNPRARDVVSVRERIRRLEAAAAEEKRRQQQQQQQQQEAARREAEVTVSPPAPIPAPAQPRAESGGGNGAMWWLIGSGVAAAGAVGMGLLASNAGNDAAEDCAETSGGRLVCRDAASDALAQETAFAIGADVFAVAAVVTAGVGIYLLLQDDGEETRPAAATRLAPTLAPDGIGVSLSGRF